MSPHGPPGRLIRLYRRLGPGLITGAADDDPSGIATYSQAGAEFGMHMLWTVVLTFPLMTAIQAVSARIGRVTGKGLAANLSAVLPRPVTAGLVALLCIANTVNIGADLAAMGAAARLVIGGREFAWSLAFAAISGGLVILVPYHRYVHVLKWLTMSLFAYVAVVFTVQINWVDVARGVLMPRFPLTRDALTVVVGVFGTTISPYLFFWQSSEEVEDEEADADAGPLLVYPEQAQAQLARIGFDTWTGMAYSNAIAFFIILTTAVTLHVNGTTDIRTSADAAEALRPVAGEFAFLLFSLGIIGTGLLALPVLAGSAAYAIGEALGRPTGLEKTAREAPGFYLVIGGSILAGLVITILPIDPIVALFWSAVLNGVIAVPIMAAMLLVASSTRLLGDFVMPFGQKTLGWTATAVMAAAALGMFVL
jgi:NRAMP (natural resistance-associated macrophage protein)-like metal ion transporter